MTVKTYNVNQMWVAYDTEAEHIRGVGTNLDEALCDLREKLNAILEAVARLQAQMNTTPCPSDE